MNITVIVKETAYAVSFRWMNNPAMAAIQINGDLHDIFTKSFIRSAKAVTGEFCVVASVAISLFVRYWFMISGI